MTILFLFSLSAWAASVRLDPMPAEVKAGQPVTIRWEAEGLPSGAQLSLQLESAETAEARYAMDGPLQQKTIPLSNGRGEFSWDAKRVACSPLDTPTFCDLKESWAYRIHAQVFRDERWLTGMMPQKPSSVLAEAKTGSFSFVAPPNLERIRSNLRAGALHFLESRIKLFSYGGTEIPSRYMEAVDEPKNEGGDFCQSYRYLAPFKGEARFCVRRAENARQLNGDVGFQPGILTYDSAFGKATALVKKTYGPKARPKHGTQIDVHISNWVYKSKSAGPYWGFLFYVGESGGTEQVPNRFAQMVLVKVDAAGTTKLKELPTIPGSSATTVDIWTEEF